jgi:large subunit ribosomal protein L3
MWRSSFSDIETAGQQPGPWKKGKNMTLGLVGRKVGMTRVFTDDGDSLPVTVLDVSDNRVTQIKTPATDGYSAVQVTFGKRHASRVNKAAAGHLSKAGVEAGHVLREFRVPEKDMADMKLGGKIGVDIFKVGQKVDVSGTSQGKGFAGVIKRHHFSSNRASHGNSLSTKKPGSTGQAQDPGRVFPGKRMAGHLGNVNRTAQNLEIVRIDAERQLLLVKGAVPGSRGRDIIVRPTSKATRSPGPSPKKAAPAAAASAKAAPAAAQPAKAAPASAAQGA